MDLPGHLEALALMLLRSEALMLQRCLCNLKLNELKRIFSASVFVTFIFGAANTQPWQPYKNPRQIYINPG